MGTHSVKSLAEIYQYTGGPPPTAEQKFDSKLALLTGMMDVSPIGDLDAVQSLVTGKLMTGKVAAKFLGRNIPPEHLSPEMRALLPAMSALPFVTPAMVKALHGGGIKGLTRLMDKFIGTGEGHFAFGWGHYATETEGIAARYAKSSARRNAPPTEYLVGDREVDPDIGRALQTTLRGLQNGRVSKSRAISRLNDMIDEWSDAGNYMQSKPNDAIARDLSEAKELIKDLKAGEKVKKTVPDIEVLREEVATDEIYEIFKEHGFDDKESAFTLANEFNSRSKKLTERFPDSLTERNLSNLKQDIRLRLSSMSFAKRKKVDAILNDVISKKFKTNTPQGQTYNLHLIPEGEENWLDWYEPVPNKHLDQLTKQATKEGLPNTVKAVDKIRKHPGNVTGEDLYRGMMEDFGDLGFNESKKAVSQLADRAGIHGVRYPTGTLGGGGNPKGIVKSRLKFEGKPIDDLLSIAEKKLGKDAYIVNRISDAEDISEQKKFIKRTLDSSKEKRNKVFMSDDSDMVKEGMAKYYQESIDDDQKVLDFLDKLEAEEYTPKNYVIFNEKNVEVNTGSAATTPSIGKKFDELAGMQRGKPESAMLRTSRAMGGGVLNPVVEHAGDLTHRMAQKPEFYEGGFEYVKEKVDRVYKYLHHNYGFEKEFQENIVNNAKYGKKDIREYKKNVYDELQKFADEHEKLPAYNQAQKLAKSLNMAIGEQRWNEARKIISKLKEHTDQGEDYWKKFSMEFE